MIDNFARKYWLHIDNFGLSVDDFEKSQKFVTNDIEIIFNGSVYLQVVEFLNRQLHISNSAEVPLLY